ncbi:unnamed protein product [Phytophthora fragariaefolia]|uniref:Unnamed protein product n=1 Tax=Phytophthora fragariaefolia TaxID=1490495 RepID=A0A9W6TWS0_9STRA|nr:unnamed protein product [Phytophthora fragariaefolia]
MNVNGVSLLSKADHGDESISAFTVTREAPLGRLIWIRKGSPAPPNSSSPRSSPDRERGTLSPDPEWLSPFPEELPDGLVDGLPAPLMPIDRCSDPRSEVNEARPSGGDGSLVVLDDSISGSASCMADPEVAGNCDPLTSWEGSSISVLASSMALSSLSEVWICGGTNDQSWPNHLTKIFGVEIEIVAPV